METENPCFRILMFPWLAHGHIFPYLELAKSILERKKSHIYFCSTAINFSSIKNFIDKNELNSSIEIVQLHLESELPPHYHTTKNLPSNLNLTLLKALQTSNSSFSDIIKTVIPDLVIYDVFQPWAAKIAAKQGIPAVHFSIFGAGPLSFVHHRFKFGKNSDFPFWAICFQDYELKTLESLFEFLYGNIYDVDQQFLFGNFKESCEVVLVKTSRGVEGKYIDYLSTLSHKKLLPVGPLVSKNNRENSSDSDIIKWLNKKTPYSTIFISFGSEYFLSRDEIHEIAKGLEIISDVNFIWIIRFPVGATGTLKEALPQGFQDRVTERGKISTGWAPQADILAHRNTGGFLSHCGWSSVMESMYFGVPVIAMPMKLDQPINAKMLVEAGSCVEVLGRENEGVCKGEEIAAAIKMVVAEEGGGGRLRRRARELSEKLKMEEEGALDQVAEQLWGLALKNKGE